jgi:hypothetical protein
MPHLLLVDDDLFRESLGLNLVGGGTHFLPAAAPVVLRRLEEAVPQLGFVHRGAPDYDIYLMQLTSVAPHFATFVNGPVSYSGKSARSAKPKLETVSAGPRQ